MREKNAAPRARALLRNNTVSRADARSRIHGLPRADMAAGSIATVLAFAGAVYGLWVAFFYDGGTAGLVPFAIAACVGAACAAFGLYRRSRFIAGFGLLLAALAPVGFAWISSAVSLLAGAALILRASLDRRKRKR